MKSLRGWVVVVLCLATVVPGTATGQDALVIPTALDFGPVPVGEWASLPLTIISDHLTFPLVVEGLSFEPGNDGGGVFSVVSIAPALPAILEYQQSVLAEIRYVPDALGLHSGVLTLVSNDHAGIELDIPVTGQGVAAAVPEPSTLGLLLAGLIALGAGGALRTRRSA